VVDEGFPALRLGGDGVASVSRQDKSGTTLQQGGRVLRAEQRKHFQGVGLV
jgi:hypothetical protein